MKAADEDELTGGNASGPVVRVGDTVRKPWPTGTERVIDYLRELRARGIDLPEHRGRDERGRQVLEYVPGRLAMTVAPLDVGTVWKVGRLVRSIHDASTGLALPEDWPVLLPVDEPDLLCHNDLATWNLVVDGDRLVFIDWDGAGPSTRLWDLAYAAISFGHLFPGAEAADCVSRLGAFLGGYEADESLREALPATLARRARAMYDMLRRAHEADGQPWGAMYLDGHGAHWRATSEFIESHRADWEAACHSA